MRKIQHTQEKECSNVILLTNIRIPMHMLYRMFKESVVSLLLLSSIHFLFGFDQLYFAQHGIVFELLYMRHTAYYNIAVGINCYMKLWICCFCAYAFQWYAHCIVIYFIFTYVKCEMAFINNWTFCNVNVYIHRRMWLNNKHLFVIIKY